VPQAQPRRNPQSATQPNPAAAERRKLREALAATHVALGIQAQRLEEQHRALDQMTAAARSDRQALRTVINRQAAMIEALGVRHETVERQVTHLAVGTPKDAEILRLGKEGYRRVASIYRQANPSNPAQPVYEPEPELPVVTEQEAAMPEAMTDVMTLGASPLTDTAPDATVPVDQPYGEAAVTPEGLTRVDVTAPVAGTNVPNPPEQVIVPGDVRFGDPDNPEQAFPWTMGPTGAPQQHVQGPNVGSPYPPMQGTQERLSVTGARTAAAQGSDGTKRAFSTMRLARLQIQAGIASGDDLTVAANLDSQGISDRAISEQIATLSKVAAVRQAPSAESEEVRHLVPRRGTTARAVPSLAVAAASDGMNRVAAKHGAAITDDEMGFV
jgi:hypothetical protein